MRGGTVVEVVRGVGASAAGVLAVASGSLGITHRALVGVALPLLVATALGAWFAHRRASLPPAPPSSSSSPPSRAGGHLRSTSRWRAQPWRRQWSPRRGCTAASGRSRSRGATTSR